MWAALKGSWAVGIHETSRDMAVAPNPRRAHARNDTYRGLSGSIDRRRRVAGLLAAPPHAQRMDSMVQHNPYESAHASLRPATKAAAKYAISGCNDQLNRHREYWVGMDYP